MNLPVGAKNDIHKLTLLYKEAVEMANFYKARCGDMRVMRMDAWLRTEKLTESSIMQQYMYEYEDSGITYEVDYIKDIDGVYVNNVRVKHFTDKVRMDLMDEISLVLSQACEDV